MIPGNAQLPGTLDERAHVAFYPLFFVPPARTTQEWRVGVEGSSLAIELPAAGASGIQHLVAGKSIAETAAALQQEYGEASDVVDLVQQLVTLGLVARIGTQSFPSPETIGQRWLQAIPSAWVTWLFSTPALLIAGALFLLGPILLLLDPAVRPSAHDLLWSSSYTLDLMLLLALGPLLVLKHELGHLLAARAKGLSGALTFGHRLFYLVAVSRIGDIWKLALFDRLIIYCAGMASDGMLASLCLLLIGITQHVGLYLPGSLQALLRCLALSEYLGLAWQCQIFLKTDVYHLFADLTNRHDLPAQALSLLVSCWQRLCGRQPLRQQQGAQRYDPLTLGYTALSSLGMAGSVLWLICYLAPATGIAVHQEILVLGTGIRTMNRLAQLDCGVALVLQCLCVALLGCSLARTYRAKVVKWRHQHRSIQEDRR